MAKKKQKTSSQRPVKSVPERKSPAFNYQDFKTKHANKFLIASGVLGLLLLFSIFKNISYPLFWADESMTAMGTERVLHFGYPKVHDGKNVFYDLKHSDPALGINKKNDAYAGGPGWAQYYFGIAGYKLANSTKDIFTQTGIYRTTYAIAGLIGLFLFAFFISKALPDQFSKFAFLSLFVLFELMSVSLALHIREVRYYSLVLLLSGIILGSYSSYRFYRPFNRIAFIILLSISFWILFNTFAPVFFILLAAVAISEIIILIAPFQQKALMTKIKAAIPIFIALLISLAGVFPLLSFYKTFTISKAMSEFNGFNSEMYWSNVGTVITYFKNFELLWLFIALKILTLIQVKIFLKENNSLLRISSFLTLVFIIFIFAIAKIPNFIYTRYIIYMQPVLAIIIILDLFNLLRLYALGSSKLLSLKMTGLLSLTGLFVLINLVVNSKNDGDHVFELTHQYMGPLDYTIPFIKNKYPVTDSLVIAANYEETSYMYYLKSKVIMGFTGNNLAQDSITQPDIIAYRKTWGNYAGIFNKFVKNAPYISQKFPVKDSPVNTIPELNFKPAFNHPFVTSLPADDKEATYLYTLDKVGD